MRLSGLFVFIVTILVLFLSTSCSVVDGVFRGDDTFVVQVDSLQVPSSVRPGDTLSLRLFGTIGPNGCHQFDHFEASRTASSLDLKVIGQRKKGGCTDMIVTLNREYRVSPPLEDPFQIRIEQPDGSILKRTVDVRETGDPSGTNISLTLLEY